MAGCGDVGAVVSLHTLCLAELSGAELLEVWTTVVEQETGDVTRAVAVVDQVKRDGPDTRALTRRLGPT